MRNRIDPRQQFSKWLARWTSVFWFFYMLYLATICILRPEVADAIVYLSIIVSVVMVVNVWAYTRNSIYEKAILAGANFKQLKFTWKGTKEEKEEDEEGEG